MSNLTLLIPAKFESESLPIFLEELKSYDYKKLIILDERDIKTIDSIKPFENIEILNQKKSGYGNALIEGINHVKTDYFCIINADGSMNPNEIKGMLNEIKNNQLDIIFGSRYMKNAGSDDDDLITSVGNYIFTFLGKIFFNLKISDILYTYLIGKTEKIKDLNLVSGDFSFCVELPIKVERINYSYGTYPCYERKRIAGKKKVSPFLDGFKILLGMINLFFKR
jgi:glycosyltransferase involved in cell wall biosynthesis